MGEWLRRYVDGERVQVWDEMSHVGAALRDSATRLADAEDVAKETMNRALTNVQALVVHLSAVGYRFTQPGSPRKTPPHQLPDADAAARVQDLEATIGSIPLSLRYWFEVVGTVDLCGEHPGWDFEYTDALQVEAPYDYVLDEHDAWLQDKDSPGASPFFVLPVSADFLHKANISGGAPYGFQIPDMSADGVLLEERHSATFVNYLRICFSHGGLPGWDAAQPHPWEWARPPESLPTELAYVASQLIPL